MWKLIHRTIFWLIVIGLILLIVHNVPQKITKKDKIALQEIYEDLSPEPDQLKTDYDYQLEIIRAVQKMSLDKIHKGYGIPFNESRELENAIEVGEGECYDRSRFIEKSLRYFGLPVRHISIFVNKENYTAIKLLASRSTNSHALTEVKTNKGWLLVDSNFEWIALDINGDPISFESLKDNVAFLKKNPQTGVDFYSGENLGVYGLYSRHGRFYRPFNPIPDYNLRELLYNF